MTAAETATLTSQALDWLPYCRPLWSASAALRARTHQINTDTELATQGKDEAWFRAARIEAVLAGIKATRTLLDEYELACVQAHEAAMRGAK